MIRFPLGRCVITTAASDRLSRREVLRAIRRHQSGDWGEVSEADRAQNEHCVAGGCRLHSVYHAEDGTEFWVITEADRSATTVLLPDDY